MTERVPEAPHDRLAFDPLTRRSRGKRPPDERWSRLFLAREFLPSDS